MKTWLVLAVVFAWLVQLNILNPLNTPTPERPDRGFGSGYGAGGGGAGAGGGSSRTHNYTTAGGLGSPDDLGELNVGGIDFSGGSWSAIYGFWGALTLVLTAAMIWSFMPFVGSND